MPMGSEQNTLANKAGASANKTLKSAANAPMTIIGTGTGIAGGMVGVGIGCHLIDSFPNHFGRYKKSTWIGCAYIGFAGSYTAFIALRLMFRLIRSIFFISVIE